jgi:hypothetical protein
MVGVIVGWLEVGNTRNRRERGGVLEAAEVCEACEVEGWDARTGEMPKMAQAPVCERIRK